jgi:multimeric flavodoxin WrbA
MKITVINGSPHGKDGITNIMASAFLKGAREAGAETVNVFLAEKEINHCRGCLSCWLLTPGQCAIKDDMAEVLAQCQGTDILALATPLKYANLSSMLKVFIERMLVLANPYFKRDAATGLTRHPKKSEAAEAKMSFYRSKLVMIANGGLPDRGPNFQIVSDWLKRLAFSHHTEVLAELYTPQGLLLTNQVPELQPIIGRYLQHLEQAGREIATGNSISESTRKGLDQDFVPVDDYNQIVNNYFDGFLSKLEHPYVKG